MMPTPDPFSVHVIWQSASPTEVDEAASCKGQGWGEVAKKLVQKVMGTEGPISVKDALNLHSDTYPKPFANASALLLHDVFRTLCYDESESNLVDQLNLFVQLGLDINAQDDEKLTLLILAMESYYRLEMRPLIDALLRMENVDVNVRDLQSHTALSQVFQRPDVLELLPTLLAKGGDLHWRDPSGRSLVTLALFSAPQTLPLLKQAGASLSSAISYGPGLHGQLPELLHFISESSHWATSAWEECSRSELIRTLLDMGADMSEKDEQGRDALSMAISLEQYDILDTLTEIQRARIESQIPDASALPHASKRI